MLLFSEDSQGANNYQHVDYYDFKLRSVKTEFYNFNYCVVANISIESCGWRSLKIYNELFLDMILMSCDLEFNNIEKINMIEKSSS